MNKLPPIDQKVFDENRELYSADSHVLDLKKLDENKCSHYLVRKSVTDVQCKHCNAGWIDGGFFNLENGHVVNTT